MLLLQRLPAPCQPCASTTHQRHQQACGSRRVACAANSGGSRRQRRAQQQQQRAEAPSGPREVVVGIDLGTTNSAIAIIEGGKPRCIPNTHGSNLTPSVVCFKEDGDVVVGREARRMSSLQPRTTYSSVKRLIGRQYADPLVQQELRNLTYKVRYSCALKAKCLLHRLQQLRR